jgi:hypothetical protein
MAGLMLHVFCRKPDCEIAQNFPSSHHSHVEVLVVLIHALQLLLDLRVPVRRIYRQNRGGDGGERQYDALEDRIDPEPAKELGQEKVGGGGELGGKKGEPG